MSIEIGSDRTETRTGTPSADRGASTPPAADAVAVLRTIWAAEGQGSADLDDDCGPTKTCRNMREVTFDGFAEPGDDIGAAWRATLAREGKLHTGSGSVRDLVLGPNAG